MYSTLYERSQVRERYRSNKVKNWIKSGLALQITKEGIQPFVEDEINKFQLRCLREIQDNNNLQEGAACTVCCMQDLRSSKYHCPNKICNFLKVKIHKAHQHADPSFRNTHVSEWCTNPWEVAKCYMSRDGYTNVKSAAKTDFNGLINVVINHTEISRKVDIIYFEKGRKFSNEIRHSPNLEIDDEDLQTYFDVFVNILIDIVDKAFNTTTQNALDELLNLREDVHNIEKDSVMRFLDEKQVVETNMQNLQLLKDTKQGLSDKTVQTQISAQTLETTLLYVTKLTALREDLITFYREVHSNIPISPLVSENDVPVADFYVQQKMHQVEFSLLGKHSTHRNDIDTYEAMFMNGSTLCRNIFIMAKAGAGKTTFAKRVCNVWCYTKNPEGKEPQNLSESATNTLNQFDILFLVLLRDVQGNECDIDEMIQSQIIKYLSRKYDDTFLSEVFHSQTCLIILDGLDEWSHPKGTTCQNIKHIPHHRSRAKCTILSTTRPWKMFESEIRNSMIDKCIELGQFNDSSSDILISNVIDTCTDEHESEKRKTKDFKSQIKKHNLDWLISTPVILIQLIFLWLKNKTLGKSKCQIYSDIIDFLSERAEEKNKQENVITHIRYKCDRAEEKNIQEKVSHSVIYKREGAEEKNKQKNVTSPVIHNREGTEEKNKQENVTSPEIYKREGAEKKKKQENVTSPEIYKREGAEEKNKQENVTSPAIHNSEGSEEKNKQEKVTSPEIYKHEGAEGKNKQEKVTSPEKNKHEGAEEKNKQEKVTSPELYKHEGAEEKNKQEKVTSPEIYKHEGAEEKNKQEKVTSPGIYTCKHKGAEEKNKQGNVTSPVILKREGTKEKNKQEKVTSPEKYKHEGAEEKSKQEKVTSPEIYKHEVEEEKNKQENVTSPVIHKREGTEEKNKQENVISPVIYKREATEKKNKQEKVTSSEKYKHEGAEEKNKQEKVTSPEIYKHEVAEEKNKQENVTSPAIHNSEGTEEKNKQEKVTSPEIYKREGTEEQFNCLNQKKLCQEYNYLLVTVGKLAFRALFSVTKERSLVFESTLVKETLSAEELNDCLRVGILTENRTNNLTARQINFSFIHKTFQEYFCALYIAAVDGKTGTNDILMRCQSIESILELSGVFVFLSGLCPKVLNSISSVLAETITKDKICQDFRRKICTSINWSTDYKILKEFQDMNIDCIQESKAENTESVNIIQEDIIIDRNCCSESYNEHLKALISMNKDNMKSVKIYSKPGSAIRSYIDDFNLIGVKHLDKLEMSVDKVNDGDLHLLLSGSTKTLKCLSVCKDIGSQIDLPCEPLSNSCVRTIQQMSNLEAIMLECFTIDHELLQDLFCFLEKKRNMTEICLAYIKCRVHDCNCTGFTLDLSKHLRLNMLEIGSIPLSDIKVNTKSLNECRVGHFNSPNVLQAFLSCLQKDAPDLQSLMCFGIRHPGELQAVLETLPSLQTLHVLVMKRFNLDDHIIDIPSHLQHIKLSSVQMSSSVFDSIVRAAEDHPSTLTCELLWCEIIPQNEYNRIKDYIQKSEKIDILYGGKEKNNTIKIKFRSKTKPLTNTQIQKDTLEGDDN